MTPVSNGIAWLVVSFVAVVDRIVVWWGYWPCTECGERTWDLEGHWQVDHADLERRAA